MIAIIRPGRLANSMPKTLPVNLMSSHNTGMPNPAAVEIARHLPKWGQSNRD